MSNGPKAAKSWVAARAPDDVFLETLLGLALCKRPCLDDGGSGGSVWRLPPPLRFAECSVEDDSENDGGRPEETAWPASAAMIGDDLGCIRGDADTGSTGAVNGCGRNVNDA